MKGHVLNANKAIQEGTILFDPQKNEIFRYTHTLDESRSKHCKPATPKQGRKLIDSAKLIISDL